MTRQRINRTVQRNRRIMHTAWGICAGASVALLFVAETGSAQWTLLTIVGTVLALLMVVCLSILIDMQRSERIRRLMDHHYCDNTILAALIVLFAFAGMAAAMLISVIRCEWIGIIAYPAAVFCIVTEVVYSILCLYGMQFYVRKYFEREPEPLTAVDVLKERR